MNNIQRKGIGKMKIYKKVIACILTLMMFFAQMPVNVFAANQKNNIPLDIVLVLDVSGSMEDPITSTDTTKRITILKDSINQFIESFAENNSKQSDEKYQSRISIIKFAGDKSDKVGNDTYTENRYRYNYTQIMNDFFTATNDNKAKLEDVVNSISPAGATRSDFAMELALKQINQSKNDESRKDAKRIVFFVTDGQPTTLNNFDDDVANGAINTSKEIKKDAEVYTFGMFSLTDPSITGHVGSGSWSDAEKFNAYMHGVSSNYSDAQSYKNLGTRAENSAYYMGAKSSKEATAIFDSVIAKLLSMTYAGADYTDVDAAIKRANSLNKDNYKDFSRVEDAINAVNRDKDITEQEVVNSYAKAINEAIDHLEYKDADYTKVTEAIEKANITLSDLALLKEDAVPEDAAALIINGPTTDFSEDDASKVIDYINRGGKVLITCNFQAQGLENFESILSACGMERVSGIVMENDKSYYYSNTPYYLLPDVNSSAYTSSVSGSYIFAPYSEAITYGEDTDDTTYTALLETTDKAVSKTDAANATTSELEEGDAAGPFAVAVAMEKTIDEDTVAKVVVAGSVEMFADSADQIVSGNNSAMFTDIIAQMVGDSDLATSVIPTKDYTLSAITVDAAAGVLYGLGLMIVLPVIMMILGIVIWASRRKK